MTRSVVQVHISPPDYAKLGILADFFNVIHIGDHANFSGRAILYHYSTFLTILYAVVALSLLIAVS